MTTRTEQDNDITLYSLSELRAMKRTHEQTPSKWQPFSKNEVLDELQKRITPVKTGDNITIIGRRWFDKANGNTYFSAVGLINGIQVVEIPYEYGYGNHYEDRIFTELEKAGYCPDVAHYSNGGSERLWNYCERKGITKYVTHSDVNRKRDL